MIMAKKHSQVDMFTSDTKNKEFKKISAYCVPTLAGVWQNFAGPAGFAGALVPFHFNHFMKQSSDEASDMEKDEVDQKIDKDVIDRKLIPKKEKIFLATVPDGSKLFCCAECHLAYPTKDLLEDHLIAHGYERQYVCDICGVGLKRKEHLDRHKQGHNPDRPFVCTVCLKSFKRNEHLSRHSAIHSGDKNEICCECGKGFYRKDHLRKHAQSHAEKRLKTEPL